MKKSLKFELGQLVEFTKDFPSIGVAAGDRLHIWSRAAAIQPYSRCPKGIRERYGFRELPNVRIYVDHLKGVD